MFPRTKMVAGSIPGWDTCLRCWFNPQLECAQEATEWCFCLTPMFLSLTLALLSSFPPPSSSLKIRKHFLRWGFKKKKKHNVSISGSTLCEGPLPTVESRYHKSTYHILGTGKHILLTLSCQYNWCCIIQWYSAWIMTLCLKNAWWAYGVWTKN